MNKNYSCIFLKSHNYSFHSVVFERETFLRLGILGKKLIHLSSMKIELLFQGEMSGVEHSKRICQSHYGLADSLMSAQGPHPLSDRLSDLVRRIFLNEMHTLDSDFSLRRP